MECFGKIVFQRIWKRVTYFVATFGGGFLVPCLWCFRVGFRKWFPKEFGKEMHGLQMFWKMISVVFGTNHKGCRILLADQG